MERKVVFSFVVDQNEDSFFSKLYINYWFNCFEPGRTWTIDVEVIREKHTGDLHGKIREVVFETYIHGGENPSAYLLAQAVNSCSSKTAEDIAHHLFWTHVVEPSLAQTEGANWFRTHARKSWEFYMQLVAHDRELQCKEIHDS